MKRKVKKFNAGGANNPFQGDDVDPFSGARDEEGNIKREAPASSTPAEPLKMASFGEAFKEARGRGDKTFEYMGKKYTTEMAKPKPKAAPKAEPAKPRTFAQKQEAAAPKMQSAYRSAVSDLKKFFTPTADNPRIRRERAEMGMKVGGKVGSASKRADGCATKGKTRGRMI